MITVRYICSGTCAHLTRSSTANGRTVCRDFNATKIVILIVIDAVNMLRSFYTININ